jgi:hypothetical protein
MRGRVLASILLCSILGHALAQNTTTTTDEITTPTPTPTSTLTLSMPPIVTLCANVDVNWDGGQPDYIFSLQWSKGDLGDESILSEDQFIFSTGGVWTVTVPLYIAGGELAANRTFSATMI